MGNILPVVSRNKEFQSVVPFPADSFTSVDDKNYNNKAAATNAGGLKIMVSPAKRGEAPGLGTPATFEEIDNSVTINSSEFDSAEFVMTEGQMRREGMVSCENQCSQITKFVFVGGQKVAENLDLLREKKIVRIVNCSLAVTKNYFENLNEFKYLSLNLLDGRQEDISWFICQVIHFIVEGCNNNERILVHCEKGISRSCSLIIAYKMWSSGQKWKEAFDYVKLRRSICSPNTAFTCNLIEWGEVLFGSAMEATLAFRCSYHADYDADTPVLKVCRNLKSRRLLVPATSMLNPKGVFVIRAFRDGRHFLYVWRGQCTSEETCQVAHRLASFMQNIISGAEEITLVRDGMEHEEFLRFFIQDGPFAVQQDESCNFDDFFDFKPPADQVRKIRNHIDEEVPAAYLPRVMHDLARESESGESNHSCGSEDLADFSPNHPTNENQNVITMGELQNTAGVSSTNKSIKGVPLNLNLLGPIKQDSIPRISLPPLSSANASKPTTPSKTKSTATEDEGYSAVGSGLLRRNESDTMSIPLPGMLSRASSYKGGTDDDPPPHRVSRASSLRNSDMKVDMSSIPPLSLSTMKAQQESTPQSMPILNLKVPSLSLAQSETQRQGSSIPALSLRNKNLDDGQPIKEAKHDSRKERELSDRVDPLSAPVKENQLSPTTTTTNMDVSSSIRVVDPADIQTTRGDGQHRSSAATKPLVSLLALPSTQENKKETSIRTDTIPADDFVKDSFPGLNGAPPESCRSNSSTSSNERPSSPVLVKNSSRKKVFPISELASPASSRPGSSERKIFGSPRIVPFIPLNTPGGSPHDQAVAQLQLGIAGDSKRPNSASSETNSSRRRPSLAGVDSSRINGASEHGNMSRRPSTPKDRLAKAVTDLHHEDSHRPSSASSSSSSSENPSKTRKEFHLTLPTLSLFSIDDKTTAEVPRLSFSTSTDAHNADGKGKETQSPMNSSGMKRPSLAISLNLPLNTSQDKVSSRPCTPNSLAKVESKPSLKLSSIGALSQLNMPPALKRSAEDLSIPLDKKSPAKDGMLSKPMLYQAEVIDSDKFEWRAMGVYDDQDLEDHAVFLLLCPHDHHYLWVGKSYDFQGFGIDIDDDQQLTKWASSVHKGEVLHDKYFGSSLLKAGLSIIRSGEESDEFWDAFNEGF